MRRTIATFFVLLPVMAANAQTLQEDAEQEPRRYTVEMIVFTYAEDIGSGGEVFVADPPPEDTQQIPTASVRFPNTGFARLRRSDFTMDDIRSRLNRLSAYEPVMHFGWTQATYPAEQTRNIELASLAASAGGIDGTVKLYLSRFLHLVVDLQMDADAVPMAEPMAEPMDDTFAPAAPLRYRIDEDRIFRSGELRYFDHPKFGVLAKVTRVEEDDVEEVDDPEPDTGELLGYPTQ